MKNKVISITNPKDKRVYLATFEYDLENTIVIIETIAVIPPNSRVDILVEKKND